MTEYKNEMVRYQNLVEDFFKKSNEVELIGGNILHIQSSFDNNLAKPRVKAYPNGYEIVGIALDKMISLQKELSSKYGVQGCNDTVRINHSIMKDNCTCKICN